MSLLFLRSIRLFLTSQIANTPFRTTPWAFCTFRFLLWSWAFIRSYKISSIHFFTSKSEQFWSFFYIFILDLNLFFWKIRICQTLFTISTKSLFIFPLFLHHCQVLEFIFSSQSQNLHPLIPC